MKIYTKTGDGGETGLFGGMRVSKNDPLVQVYGTIDELNAALGLAHGVCHASQKAQLQELQSDLFVLGAELACAPGKTDKLRLRLIDAEDSVRLERWIDAAEEELPQLSNFVLPGGSPGAAHLHLARAICRRAEREFVGVQQRLGLRPELGIFLNRLSDLLFVLARQANARAELPDVLWQGRN
jgi:cob(I)alamin adenosyltransferase